MAEYTVTSSANSNGKPGEPSIIGLTPDDPTKSAIKHIAITTDDETLQKLMHKGRRVEIRIFEPEYYDSNSSMDGVKTAQAAV
jgi:hypothetical protein